MTTGMPYRASEEASLPVDIKRSAKAATLQSMPAGEVINTETVVVVSGIDAAERQPALAQRKYGTEPGPQPHHSTTDDATDAHLKPNTDLPLCVIGSCTPAGTVVEFRPRTCDGRTTASVRPGPVSPELNQTATCMPCGQAILVRVADHDMPVPVEASEAALGHPMLDKAEENVSASSVRSKETFKAITLRRSEPLDEPPGCAATALDPWLLFRGHPEFLRLYARLIASEQSRGPEHEETVTARNVLSHFYVNNGHYALAVPLLSLVLAHR